MLAAKIITKVSKTIIIFINYK